MDGTGSLDLLGYYEQHFAEGMVDLSSSSPTPVKLPGGGTECYDLGYAAPGGSELLRSMIAARYATLTADDVVVTSGASEALAAVTLATVRLGDVVFVADGAYPTVHSLVAALGAHTTRARSRACEARVSVIANPTVPSGGIEDVAWFAKVARQHGGRLVVDEVYRELALTGERVLAACDIDATAVSIGDLSKPLGLGGLRVGWLASRDRALIASVRRQLQLLSGGPAAPSVVMAEGALKCFDEAISGVLDVARGAARRTYAVLREFGWSFEAADAGLTVMARPPVPLGEESLRNMRTRGWFLLPSSVFGIERGFRISLLHPDELRVALSDTRREGRNYQWPGLVVLTKVPSSGRSKTRLADSVGAEVAAAFAHAFVRDTLGLVFSGAWRTYISVPAPGADAWLQGVAGPANFLEQPEGDLGERIRASLQSAMSECGEAILIGSDTPDLPREYLSEAFAALQRSDVVVGPARDGGFYLLGARRFEASLFDGIAWSTPTVCARLIENAERLNLNVALLPEWDDVDDMASLVRLAERLERGGSAPSTAAVLRESLAEASHVP